MSLQKRFKARYPKANFADFKTGDFFGKPNIFFHNKAGDEETAVFDDDGKDFRSSIYFSKEMKRQLGLAPGFPLELTHNPNPKLEIPAVPFNSETANRRSAPHNKRRSCSTRNICHPERKIQNKVSRYFY